MFRPFRGKKFLGHENGLRDSFYMQTIGFRDNNINLSLFLQFPQNF